MWSMVYIYVHAKCSIIYVVYRAATNYNYFDTKFPLIGVNLAIMKLLSRSNEACRTFLTFKRSIVEVNLHKQRFRPTSEL